MVLEATMICIDNSEWMRNGDYSANRFQAQADAVNLICGAKTQSNPENTVGILTMAGKGVRVLVTPTSDLGKILACMHGLEIGGEMNLAAGIQVAQLALKHRQNKKQHQRIIVFAGSPVKYDKKVLEMIGRKLKKNSVALDVVDFGEDEEGKSEKLEALVAAVNNNDTSHIVHVPSGPNALSDVLISTPIFTGDGEGGSGFAAAAAAAAAGGVSGFDFGVDPNLDPELALALRVSMEEERARQEAAAKRAAEEASREEKGGEQDATMGESSSASNPEADKKNDLTDDENALLQQALAMSMDDPVSTAVRDTEMSEATTDDPDLKHEAVKDLFDPIMTGQLSKEEERAEMEERRMERLRTATLNQEQKSQGEKKKKEKNPKSEIEDKGKGTANDTPYVTKKRSANVPMPKTKSLKRKKPTSSVDLTKEPCPTPQTKNILPHPDLIKGSEANKKMKEVQDGDHHATQDELDQGLMRSTHDLIEGPWSMLKIKEDEELGYPRHPSLKREEQNAYLIMEPLQSFVDWCPADEMGMSKGRTVDELANIMLYETAAFSSKMIRIWARLKDARDLFGQEYDELHRAEHETLCKEMEEEKQTLTGRAEKAEKEVALIQEECIQLRAAYEDVQSKYEALRRQYDEDLQAIKKHNCNAAAEAERNRVRRALLQGYPEDGEQIWEDIQSWSRWIEAYDLKADLLDAGYTEEEADQEVKARFGVGDGGKDKDNSDDSDDERTRRDEVGPSGTKGGSE